MLGALWSAAAKLAKRVGERRHRYGLARSALAGLLPSVNLDRSKRLRRKPKRRRRFALPAHSIRLLTRDRLGVWFLRGPVLTLLIMIHVSFESMSYNHPSSFMYYSGMTPVIILHLHFAP